MTNTHTSDDMPKPKKHLWLVDREPDYDEYGAMAVIAEDEECARLVAHEHANEGFGKQYAGEYLDAAKTTVTKVPLKTEGVVLAYMLHG